MPMTKEEIEEFEERIRGDLERDYDPDDYKGLLKEYEKSCPGGFDEIKIKIGTIMADQVAVVGSNRIYQKIHESFLEEKVEPLFVKEQFDLYIWRANFFRTNFPNQVFGDVVSNWWTAGSDDSHFFDTLPFNITKHFDRVVTLACIPPYNHPHGKVWFDNDGDGDRINNLYDLDSLDFLEEEGFGYSDAAHRIVAACQTGPLKLEHLAMKKVLEYQIPLDEVPKEVKVRVAVGMFDGTEDIPDYISNEGREAFEDLRREFGFTD